LLVVAELVDLPVQVNETLEVQAAVQPLQMVQLHMMVKQNVVAAEELKAEQHFQMAVTLLTLHSSTVV
jgi:hypothetical protein